MTHETMDFPDRLSLVDLDALGLALREFGQNGENTNPRWSLRILAKETPRLLNYTRWLYARRGRIVEQCRLLTAIGHITQDELDRIETIADWDEQDEYTLLEAQKSNKQWW